MAAARQCRRVDVPCLRRLDPRVPCYAHFLEKRSLLQTTNF